MGEIKKFEYPEDEIIHELAHRKSFIDIGGLWGTVREKVTVALDAGAYNAVMMDIQPNGNELWQAFHARAEEKGHKDKYSYLSSNLDYDDNRRPPNFGPFDVVHCSGIIYHAPNPLHMLMRLRAVTKEYLLLGSMTVAETIDTPAGTLDMTGGASYFIPSLNGKHHDIFKAYFENLNLEVHNISSKETYPWMEGPNNPNYGPWWWIWTPDTLARMAEVVGFEKVKIIEAWPGRSHYILLKAVDVPVAY